MTDTTKRIQKFSNFSLYVINNKQSQWILLKLKINILNFTRPHAITYTNRTLSYTLSLIFFLNHSLLSSSRVRSEFQANAVSTTREKCLVRKTIPYFSSFKTCQDWIKQSFLCSTPLPCFSLCSLYSLCHVLVFVRYFVDSTKCVILQAIILCIIFGPNETICNSEGTDVLN